MGRFVALGNTNTRVLFKGIPIALLLSTVLLVFLLLQTDEKNKFLMKVSHEDEGDCSSNSLEKRLESGLSLSRDGSMESAHLISLTSKRRVPKGPDPIHNRRSGNRQKPPSKP